MASDAVNTTEQESKSLDTPEAIISKGKTFLAVNDYFNAVGILAEGCRLLSEKYCDVADELAEPYIYYGRALLGLAREEWAVLGAGVSGTKPGAEEEEAEAENKNAEVEDENEKSGVDK